MSEIFIGSVIRAELQRQERTTVWFAKKLGCNRTNAYKIFNRRSIDTDLLLRISRILNRNFFEIYTEGLGQ
ncbi:MAG: XRE family transcriptional regulator [Paramuribaculum sp.]|nr:XRE family transcriptional regulator [Paramuribaculum sp.]